MAAVWMQLGAELRRRWRAWAGLAVLIGLAFGAVTALAAGARRTETAYERFLQAHNAPDITTGGISGPEEAFLPGLEILKELPQVAEWASYYAFPGEVVTERRRSVAFPQVITIGDERDRSGKMLRRLKILRGRHANPAADDEATLSFAAEAPDLTIGTTATIVLSEDAGFPKRFEIPVRVVGIHAAPGEFQSINGVSFPTLYVSAGVVRAHRKTLDLTEPSNVLSLDFRLKRGAADVPAFRAEATRRGVLVDLPLEMAEHLAGVRKTMRFEAAALWLLAGLIGLTAFAVFGQALARLSFLEAVGYPALRALGMSRSAMTAVGVVRAAVVGVAAAAVATATALLASPLMPIGSARIAEPEPGFDVDPWVLAAGGAGTILIVVLSAVAPSLRAARVRAISIAAAEPSAASRPSAVAEALARSSAPSSMVSGVRFALEPGRGRTAVPVRSTIAGVAAGLAALIMALTFQSSLSTLIDSPELSGYTWDLLAAGPPGPELVARMNRDPAVRAAGQGGAVNVAIGDSRMLAFVWDHKSPIRPVILEGRVPRTTDEIALGTKTMRDAGVRIGGRVEVKLASSQGHETAVGERVTYEVVGRSIIPQLFFEPHEPGEGAAMTLDAYFRLERIELDQVPALISLRDPADLNSMVQRLRREAFVAVRQSRGDMITIERLSSVPLVLSGILAALAGAALVHALLSTIRRRRRDVAILKTLGFHRRQVRATFVWEAVTLVVMSFVLAVPAGIVAGRWLWALFADQIAVLSRPEVPLAEIAVIIPAALGVAVAVALIPARSAARTRPALVLRTE